MHVRSFDLIYKIEEMCTVLNNIVGIHKISNHCISLYVIEIPQVLKINQQ